MDNYDERICRHALNRIFGFHPATALALLERFGSGRALFSIGGSRLLEEAGAGYRDIGRIGDREYGEAERELHEMEESGARFLCDIDPDYPALLKECADRPVGLYVKSDSSDKEVFDGKRRFIAVVGTRDISPYGSEWCARIVGSLAASGEQPTIVSGLAIGTDIIAHRKAMDSGMPTIAVLPTGIDAVYPARHRGYASKIVSTPRCALITDYPPKTAPVPYNFLRRNRIIAGMCEATVLIESGLKGGGMMTAGLASSYCREVYALPGRIEDLRSQGCNALIKQKLAEPIVSEHSLATGLGMKTAKKRARVGDREFVRRRLSGMNSERIEKLSSVLLTIKESGCADIEQIMHKCGLEYREAAELVALLESDGMINVDLMQRCTINYG